MPAAADRRRIEAFLAGLGARVRAPHTVYLVGGTSAVLSGWRDTTLDIDLRPEPDSDELLRALVDLKRDLDIAVELASPLDFLPDLAGWRERSPWVSSHGPVHARHLDFRLQALAKVERGLRTDLADVEAMLERGLVTSDGLRAGFAEMSERMFRFPAVDLDGFERRLGRALDR